MTAGEALAKVGGIVWWGVLVDTQAYDDSGGGSC